MNSLGEDGLEGAKARAGNDLSRIVSSELLGPPPRTLYIRWDRNRLRCLWWNKYSWATTRVEEIQPYSTIRTTKANANTQRVPGDLSDSETSGEDDGQMLTRDAIKKQVWLIRMNLATLVTPYVSAIARHSQNSSLSRSIRNSLAYA